MLFRSSYQEETINILSDLINVVPNNYTDEWTFITHHREQGDPELCYFLRDIFLSRIKNDFNTSGYERIYIRRSKSHLCKGNADENFIRRRQIINEDQIVEKLSEIGIKSVYFEDYTVSEKIQIFQNASLVVAPQSGGLLFTLFGHQNMDIVEICPTNTHQPCNHYVDICNVLNIPFRRFDDVIKNDYHDNKIGRAHV